MTVDVGGLSRKRWLPIDRAEAANRTGLILRAMKQMGYEATGIGTADRRLGDRFFEEAKQAGVPIIASMDGHAEEHDNVVETLVREFDGHKVGFAAIPSQPTSQGRLKLEGLVRVLKQLREECGTVILLSQLGYRDDVRLVETPGMRGLVDVLIGNSDAKLVADLDAEGDLRWTREHAGVTFVRNAGEGKTVFVLAVRTGWLARPRYICRGFNLTAEMPEDPKLREQLDAYHEGWEQRFLQLSAELIPPRDEWKSVASTTCAQCHPDAYEAWAETRHAHAVATLREEGKRVPDCLSCHSQIYRSLHVFADDHQEPQGVECVTCHRGPAEQHVKAPSRANIQRANSEGACKPCHTSVNSPEFDYLDYRDRIQHWED